MDGWWGGIRHGWRGDGLDQGIRGGKFGERHHAERLMLQEDARMAGLACFGREGGLPHDRWEGEEVDARACHSSFLHTLLRMSLASASVLMLPFLAITSARTREACW